MTPGGRSDEGLLELLDAYLDGELDAEERGRVDALLARSPEARSELADIDRVRALVRGLPPVDAPFGFYERLTRRRHRAPGLVFASVGAVAAAIVLILAITPVVDRVAPPVDDLAERHAVLASATGAMPAGYEAMPMEDVQDMGEAAPPEHADGFERMAAYDAPEGVHLVYALGPTRVSVFEQIGDLAWGSLPAGGSRMSIGGAEAWTMEEPAAHGVLTVVARDGMVVTVVGDVTLADAAELAGAMPAPDDPSLADRVGDACSWIAEGFGFPA